MESKVALLYENGEYSICINETVINTYDNIEDSFEKFKMVVKNNSVAKATSWDSIEENLMEVKDERLEINSEYKTIAFESMRYFYNTGKIFYIKNGEMVELIRGYNLFYFTLTMVLEGKVQGCEDILEFCKEVLDNKITYGITDTSILVSSAAFNYGYTEYNFTSGKINKGASIEKCSFDEFKAYVLGIIRK
ncbi:hypothetical protein GCM10008908_10800 [Clostridium subterminale]|uniref:Uncharacterized protein n=1 Tax=Clostridium subterminale TaxID=1550 RepID=A0ABN1KKB4_CLOSU